MMQASFGDCVYCGGHVEERRGRREVHWKGELVLVDDVPLGVCIQCGERFVKPQVAKAIDRLLESGARTRKVLVPVLTYAAEPP